MRAVISTEVRKTLWSQYELGCLRQHSSISWHFKVPCQNNIKWKLYVQNQGCNGTTWCNMDRHCHKHLGFITYLISCVWLVCFYMWVKVLVSHNACVEVRRQFQMLVPTFYLVWMDILFRCWASWPLNLGGFSCLASHLTKGVLWFQLHANKSAFMWLLRIWTQVLTFAQKRPISLHIWF